VNLLEAQPRPVSDQLSFRPYEIKTVRLMLEAPSTLK
jgi:hypothetical protein